jgi:ureidoglycolate dehydrogenase (NAD+)
VAAARGEQLPEGSALTATGEPTTDATKAVIPLPLGGPKGSGISLMTEIVNSVMTGSPIFTTYRRPDGSTLHRQNAMIIAFKVEAFRSLAEFNRDLEAEIAIIRALPLAAGVDAVRLPGERSGRVAVERRRDGIPMPGKLWDDTLALARELNVAPPATL